MNHASDTSGGVRTTCLPSVTSSLQYQIPLNLIEMISINALLKDPALKPDMKAEKSSPNQFGIYHDIFRPRRDDANRESPLLLSTLLSMPVDCTLTYGSIMATKLKAV